MCKGFDSARRLTFSSPSWRGLYFSILRGPRYPGLIQQ